jgi:hypothetical protein
LIIGLAFALAVLSASKSAPTAHSSAWTSHRSTSVTQQRPKEWTHPELAVL